LFTFSLECYILINSTSLDFWYIGTLMLKNIFKETTHVWVPNACIYKYLPLRNIKDNKTHTKKPL
jgi:hypothetical protein